MDDVQTREAVFEDLDCVLLLSDELTFSDLPYDQDVDIHWAHSNNGREYYSEKINRKNGICFVAEYNLKIVGYVTAAIKEISSYRLVKVAELENLVVSKGLRGKGVGETLLKKFIEWAKEIGVNKACVNVFTLNERGIAFYEREGFIPYESILEMPLKLSTEK